MTEQEQRRKPDTVTRGATDTVSESISGNKSQGVRFTIGGYSCIDAASDICEITVLPTMTVVPNTAHWFSGVATYRGEPLPVTDLAAWCGVGESFGSAQARLLVLQTEKEKVGLLVDSVQGLQSTPAGNPDTGKVEGIPGVESTGVEPGRLGLLCVAHIDISGDDVLLLELRRLLMQDSFEQIAAVPVEMSAADRVNAAQSAGSEQFQTEADYTNQDQTEIDETLVDPASVPQFDARPDRVDS